MLESTIWEIVNVAILVTVLFSFLYCVYKSIRHRILYGDWPRTVQRRDWLAEEVDRDMQRMIDEGNPAIPGTMAYLSRQARIQASRDFEDA